MTNILTRNSRGGLLAGRERPVRPGLVLAVVLIGQFMAVLDASIVNVAAPSIHVRRGLPPVFRVVRPHGDGMPEFTGAPRRLGYIRACGKE